MSKFRLLAFAESTRRTYLSQQMLFLHFCASLNIAPVPISPDNLGCYIAFLANRLCYSSVRQYLNIVRLMHLDAGLTNPLSNSWYLSSILKGLKRHKGNFTHQKLPITWNLLHGIFEVLDLSRTFDLSFWAACLVAFFSFFRKSNLLVQSLKNFDPKKHLCRTLRPFGGGHLRTLVKNNSISAEGTAHSPATYCIVPVLPFCSPYVNSSYVPKHWVTFPLVLLHF